MPSKPNMKSINSTKPVVSEIIHSVISHNKSEVCRYSLNIKLTESRSLVILSEKHLSTQTQVKLPGQMRAVLFSWRTVPWNSTQPGYQSFKHQQTHAAWKTSYINPIPQIPSPKEHKGFRLIALTPVMKALERNPLRYLVSTMRQIWPLSIFLQTGLWDRRCCCHCGSFDFGFVFNAMHTNVLVSWTQFNRLH